MAANNLTNTKAELISSLVQRELINSAILVPFMEDLSSMAMKGYNSISIPKLSNFTVADRAFGAAGADNAALTDSKDTIDLDEVLVKATRVDEKAPFVQSNVTKEEIESRNLGQDIPVLLNFLPNVVSTSDAGNGIGYTGIRV